MRNPLFIILIITFIFFLGCRNSLSALDQNIEPSGKIENDLRIIEVKAFQFSYSPNPLVVKLNEKVSLRLTSEDVTHGFYIAEYDINAVIKKGEITKVDFLADKQGTFQIICSVYCGRGHSKMKGKLIVIR